MSRPMVAIDAETYNLVSKLAKTERRTKGGVVANAVFFYVQNFAQKQSKCKQTREAVQ